MRVNFNYFISETVFRYIVDAVEFVAQYGWKFLPLYEFDAKTGLWQHRDQPDEHLLSLKDVDYDSGRPVWPTVGGTAPEAALADYLGAARSLADELPDHTEDAGESPLGARFEELRWFELPALSIRM